MAASWHYLVEVTGLCNLACPSCPNGNSTSARRKKGLMDFGVFKKIIDKIAREPVKQEYVSLYSWGEPLLHPDVAEMVRYINGYHFRCTISTNLNYQKHLHDVVRANPFQLRVSLSGYNNDFYSRTHVRGDIEKVREGLSALRRYLNETHASTLVEVCYHKYRDNTGSQLQEMKNLCDRLGFKFVPTWAYMMPVEKIIRYVDADTLQPGYPEDTFAINEHDHAIIDLLAIKPDELIKLHLPYKNNACVLRDSQTAINFDGSVALCCGVWDDAYTISDDFCTTDHDELQKRKHAAPLCSMCRKNALHMVGVNYKADEIDAIARKRTHGANPGPCDPAGDAASYDSVADFMQTVTILVEQGQTPKAISYYDAHRRCFESIPELLPFDALIEKVRKKIAEKPITANV